MRSRSKIKWKPVNSGAITPCARLLRALGVSLVNTSTRAAESTTDDDGEGEGYDDEDVDEIALEPTAEAQPEDEPEEDSDDESPRRSYWPDIVPRG